MCEPIVASSKRVFYLHEGRYHFRSKWVYPILLPERSESMLSRVVASTQSMRVVPEKDIVLRLLRALGRDQVCEAAIFPVVIKQRVVNLLDVDNGVYPIAQTTFSALQTLVECTSSAYTNLIKRQKEEKAA